ncbi:MAG: 4-alpha-glucanotransferase [Opitutaceae bacterium]
METPLFNWLDERGAGVLLHPTALPSEYGVGAFDEAAFSFLEFLGKAEFKYWQICPLGPTGYGDSPYQCFSAFAGNPYLIDPAALVSAGLLSADSIAPLRVLAPDRVDFGALYQLKLPILFSAYENWKRSPARALPYGDFAEFQKKHAAWLCGYAFFSALKEHFGGKPWWEWPAEIRSLERANHSPLKQRLAPRAEAFAFLQYLFFGQWAQLRQRATKLGISIIGDTPIFAALDSADVWANPHLFQLDPNTLRPLFVAGVPPDYFSADGQLWGNPLYAWPAHQADGYAWWIDRLRTNFELTDIIRIDHFRGFDSYWAIPAGAANARSGSWERGPGIGLFKAIRAALPNCKLIAEDLGELSPSVVVLREATGLPGMSILQFAFGGKADNLYLPHNHCANTVVYPGTHDNDTTRGWYSNTDEKTRDHVRRYLRVSGSDISWDFVRACYSSPANLAVFPLQDLLNLDSAARFNTPGKPQGNWTWRYRAEQLRGLRDNSAVYLRELAALYGRDRSTEPVKKATAAETTSSSASSST